MRALQKVTFASLIVTAVAIAADPCLAQTTQKFPVRPIRIVVPFTPGSAADLVARRIAPKMSENWGQQVVVDNRAGAGGVVGIGTVVAAAAPNGYTLLVHSLAFAVSAALYSKLPFDAFKDFSPVSQIVISTSVVVVAPALGVKSVNELIALAKQKPGQINYASAGIGSGTHLNGEQFRFAAGINVAHVPYKGIAGSAPRHHDRAHTVFPHAHGSSAAAYQGRPFARARGDHRAARADAAGRADGCGGRSSRLRIPGVVRHVRAGRARRGRSSIRSAGRSRASSSCRTS